MSYVNDVKWGHGASGSRLASASRDKTVRVWSIDPANGATKSFADFRGGHQHSVEKVAWSPGTASPGLGDEVLASLSQREVVIWDAGQSSIQKPIHTLSASASTDISADSHNNVGICWRPDGMVLAVNDAGNKVTFYDNRMWRPISSCQIDQEIDEISWDPLGTFLFVPCANGTVRVYDTSADTNNMQHPISVMHGHTSNCFCVDFDRRRNHVIIGSSDSLISLWDARSLICLRSFGRSSDYPVVSARFSCDGQFIAAAFTNTKHVDIIDVDSGESVQKLKTRADITALDWHSSQPLLAYACNDTDRFGRPDGNFRIFGIPSAMEQS